MCRNAGRVLDSLASFWRRAVILVACGLVACSPRVVPPPEPPLSVRRGDEAFHYQEYAAAINHYHAYLEQTENGAYTVRAFYKSALAAYRLGRYQDTLKTLDEFEQRYPGSQWVQVDALRGDAEHSLGNTMQALDAWDVGWRFANSIEREKLQQRIIMAAKDLDSMELARARRLVSQSDIVRLLDRELAKRKAPPRAQAEEEGEAELEEMAVAEPPSAATAAKKPAAAPSKVVVQPVPAESAAPTARRPVPAAPLAAAPPAAAPLADNELPPLDQESTDATTNEAPVRGDAKIGVLLPLTGGARDFGQQVLRGVRLALGEHGPPVVLKDTGSDPAMAVRAFDDLSRDPNVLAVVGPLRSDHAEAVAPEAERSRLPLFLLSQRDGLDRPYVLQVGMTRSRLVATLLDYAMTKARLRRFAVLYPDDAFGKEFVSAFRAEAARRGAQLVGAESYPPGDLNREAGTLRKWRDAADLQAIFLPDGATPAARLAKFLQREMPDVTLLGAYGWEGLAEHTAGAGLSGVLFADPFYAGSTRPATRDFVDRFTAVYAKPPDVLETQAYDAALLVKRAFDAGARSRADVMQRLRGVGPLDGATGDLQVTTEGLQRSLFLLQVYDGKLQEISVSEG